MPTEYTHPGVYIEEIPSQPKPIEGVATSTTAFLGWTSEGAADKVESIESWTDFENKFGGLDPRSLLGYSVRHFFDNGGREACVVRLGGDEPLHPNTPEFHDSLFPDDEHGGLYQLDHVDIFNLLCVPGETDPTIIAKLQKFCRDRRGFLIVDCAETAGVQDLKNGPGNITGDDAINSAFYFPWIVAPDETGQPRAFPPCGFVSGVYARTDTNRGVWKAPAGSDGSVTGAFEPSKEITDGDNELLNPLAVNCIRSFPERGTIIWGARTLRGGNQFGSEWKYVPVRRMALFIEESICRGLEWAVFEPNDEPLWTKIRQMVENFLFGLFRQGALQGTKSDEAYFVRCGRDTMTQNDIDSGIVNIEIGFAALKPAEFVIIRLQQLAGQTRPAPVPHIDTLAELIESAITRKTMILSERVTACIDEIVREMTSRQRGNAIFVGEKGTGKTMAAGLIAEQLGTKLYRVDLSSVVSEYIGETEKNLDRIFKAAEEAGVVLLFDEADALFGKRSEVKDAHDRYANIEIGYLLQRLEEHKGLAILTANSKQNIDEAFKRRLCYLVDFPFASET
jgi:uncharacterized protein